MKQPPRIAVIVGGHGEVEALPLLIHRIAKEQRPPIAVDILPPIRVPEDRLRRESELERHVLLASRKLGGRGGIFVLLDCDWKEACPKYDGPILLARARKARSDLPISVVLANREFENWFIAAIPSIRGKSRLAKDIEPVEDPERIRGAKEWLSRYMPRGQPYTPTGDQAALVQAFDMAMARRQAPSFDKCYRDLCDLLSKASAAD